jgi:hypothetical protein
MTLLDEVLILVYEDKEEKLKISQFGKNELNSPVGHSQTR